MAVLEEAVGVSLGLAHRVLVRPGGLGAVRRLSGGRLAPAGRRQGVDPRHLARGARRWTVSRQSLFRLARSPAELRAGVTEALESAEIDHAVTGATAVDVVAPFATAVPVIEVWVRDDASTDAARAALGAREVAQGAHLRVFRAPGDAALACPERRGGLLIAHAPQVLGL